MKCKCFNKDIILDLLPHNVFINVFICLFSIMKMEFAKTEREKGERERGGERELFSIHGYCQ